MRRIDFEVSGVFTGNGKGFRPSKASGGGGVIVLLLVIKESVLFGLIGQIPGFAKEC
jgi:hypothetical protein